MVRIPVSPTSPLVSSAELAARWRMTASTLCRWRRIGRGPSFLRLGGRVFYPDAEVARYEQRHLGGSFPADEPQ
jgi:predicted site-specific integrase-resolvase